MPTSVPPKPSSVVAKRVVLLIAVGIILVEIALLALHFPAVSALVKTTLWATPLIIFKSLLKKLLVMNFFGLLKVSVLLLWHLTKLLFIKLLKTVGIRYGAYFSQHRWQFISRITLSISHYCQYRLQRLQAFLQSFNRLEYALIILAFLPLFALLFLLGIGFKMTREVMVKKGSEIGVTRVAMTTAKKSHGLVARIKQLDNYILSRIRSR